MNINLLSVIIILCTINITLNAQQFIDGRIEFTDGSPGMYIQLQNLRSKRLALSDKEGRFHQFMMPDDNIQLIYPSIKDFKVRFDSLAKQLIIIANKESMNTQLIDSLSTKELKILKSRKRVKLPNISLSNKIMFGVCYSSKNIQLNTLVSVSAKLGSNVFPTLFRTHIFKQKENGFPYGKMIISSSVVEVDKLTWYEFDFLTPFEIPESGFCVAIEPVLPSTMKKSTIKELNVLLGGVKSKGIHPVILNDYSLWYKSGIDENNLPVAFQLKGFN